METRRAARLAPAPSRRVMFGLLALSASAACADRLAGDERASQPPARSPALDAPLARVGGAEIDGQQLQAFMAASPDRDRTSLGDGLDRLIRQELFAQQAEREGYLEAPAVRAAVRTALAHRVRSILKGDTASNGTELLARIERGGAQAADHAALDRAWLAITTAASRALEPEGGQVRELTLGMEAEDGARILAEVDGAQLTAADFLEFYRRLHPAMKQEYNKPHKRNAALDGLAARLALAQEGRRRNLHREVAIRQVARAALARAWLDDNLGAANASEPTEAELRSFYDRRKETFSQPEQVQLDHLLFRQRPQAEAALARLKASRAAHRWFKDARDLEGGVASTLPFVAANGEQQVPEPKIPRALIRPGFELTSAGDLYPHVIRSDDGYHVIRLSSRRAQFEQSFESARGAIRRAVLEERRAQREVEILARLRRELRVSTDERALGRLQAQR